MTLRQHDLGPRGTRRGLMRVGLLAAAWAASVAIGAAAAYSLGKARGEEAGEAAGRQAAAWSLGRFAVEDDTELEALARLYGPAHNSQYAEEWIVRDYFKDQRGGIFVDVGANHHQQYSNTYFLETVLEWSGVAIEPQTRFAAGYTKSRPRTTFVPLFVSDVSNRQATLYVTDQHLVASTSREFTESFGGTAAPTPVATTTLDDVLDRLGMTHVDFVSIDIELAEPAALAGFSIDRFTPRLVAVEAHPPVRQQLLDYFARHGYVLVGKYWRVDDENFWFAPVAR